MKNDERILIIKKINKIRRGQIEIIFKQKSVKPYETQDTGLYKEGMVVKLHKGKLTPYRE